MHWTILGMFGFGEIYRCVLWYENKVAEYGNTVKLHEDGSSTCK